MKIYPANQITVTNSTTHKPEPIEVPPFFFKGRLSAGLSGKWYPKETITITGGYFAAAEIGSTTAGLVLVKGNIFEQNLPVATTLVQATDLKQIFEMEEPMLGNIDVSPYEYLRVASFSTSAHKDVTCYFTAVRKL